MRKLISLFLSFFVVMLFFGGIAFASLSSEKITVQKPHEYLTMTAKNKEYGEAGTCPSGCKWWRVRLMQIIKESEQVIRTIKYTLVYGEVTEEEANQSGYPSQNYILVERFEIVSDGNTIFQIMAAYVDFGPDSNIDRAYATGPRGVMGLNPGQANKYFWEFRYPELRKFIKNGWFFHPTK